MQDETEQFRRGEVARINALEAGRKALEQMHGEVWNTEQLGEAFDVVGFGAPYCTVVRKSDRVAGSLEFQHSPRFYYNFQET